MAEDFQRINATNLIAPFQMCRAAAPKLRKTRGSIVNVSSLASLLGTGSSIAYAASKAAPDTMSMSLARVLAPEVRVNVLAPGFVETPWLVEGYGSRYRKIKEAYEGIAPMKSVAMPADVASAIAWLVEGPRRSRGRCCTWTAARTWPRLGRSDMADWRKDLVAQLKNRALVYLEVYDMLAEELGAAKAEELLARAVLRRGRAAGAGLAKHAPADFAGLKATFLKGAPGEGKLFSPEVKRCDPSGLHIQFHACALKDAWQEAGLAPEKWATLCRIAGAVDRGMFEAAGFAIDNRTWTPGHEGCCELKVSRK